MPRPPPLVIADAAPVRRDVEGPDVARAFPELANTPECVRARAGYFNALLREADAAARAALQHATGLDVPPPRDAATGR